MGITYHRDLVQGSEEWAAARCGLLCASEMKLIMTAKTLKAAENDACRAHVFELLAQRITRYVEPRYVSDDMLRGTEDEIEARQIYVAQYEPIEEVGFVTNDSWGFTLGYSPDGLVGRRGLWECKSRRQRFQVETILGGVMPADFVLQCQTGLLVTEREWLDFSSYSGGLPMVTIRVFPDEVVQAAILEAAEAFEAQVERRLATYRAILEQNERRLVPTERRVEMEMYA